MDPISVSATAGAILLTLTSFLIGLIVQERTCSKVLNSYRSKCNELDTEIQSQKAGHNWEMSKLRSGLTAKFDGLHARWMFFTPEEGGRYLRASDYTILKVVEDAGYKNLESIRMAKGEDDNAKEANSENQSPKP